MGGWILELLVDVGDPALVVSRQEIEVALDVGRRFADGRAVVFEKSAHARDAAPEVLDALAVMCGYAAAVDEAVQRIFDRGFEPLKHRFRRVSDGKIRGRPSRSGILGPRTRRPENCSLRHARDCVTAIRPDQSNTAATVYLPLRSGVIVTDRGRRSAVS